MTRPALARAVRSHPARPFRPPRWLAWRQAQTWGLLTVPLGLPANLPLDEPHEIVVAPGTSVRVHVTARPEPLGTLLLLHGLAGHAGARIMRRTEGIAWRAGWTVVRMNYRTCGGTVASSSTLINAGLSGDIAAVLASPLFARLPRPHVAIGYSLGGNMLLKYLGEAAPMRDGEEIALFGDNPFDPDGPGRAGRHIHHAGQGSRLEAAVAVSPPIDLSRTCRHLERKRNLVYHLLFTTALLRLARQRHRLERRPGPLPALWRTPTMRRFDHRHTAPDAGYASPEAYYRGASSLSLLPRITTPTLVLTAKDDPIIPVDMFTPLLDCNPAIRWVLTDRGGHCGWIERMGLRLRSWATPTALEFLEAEAPVRRDRAHPPPAWAQPAEAPIPQAGGTAIAP